MPNPLDTRHRNLKRSLVACCVVALISAVIILSLNMVVINNYRYYDTYYYNSVSTMTAIVITEGVISILLQFMGIAGAHKEHYGMCLTYAVISSILGGLCFANAIIYGYGGNWWLAVLYFTCGCVGSYFAKDIKRLKTQALNTTVYMNGVSGQQNIVYHVPPPGQVGPVYGVNTQQMAPNGQMYMSTTFSTYQPSQQPLPFATYPAPVGVGGGAQYAEPPVLPPSYTESATSSQPNMQAFGAPDPHTNLGPGAGQKPEPPAPGWQP
ncbi:unnamed protein product [Oppiella nova]|uniref:Uncharacterized protein n=1 Tax=Oppiella nova TaxID=334625 RepID=A0A7R9LZU5_9ACAR|nr:unnamed protein product [Oppiella nova]CAG2168512.1 unnamed protein product [Oppiella nova]